MPLPRLFNPKWMVPPGMQCTSMRGKTRCVLMNGHAGWHHNGQWTEWLGEAEREAAYRKDPCQATVTMGERTIPCELPSKHNIAHRGDDMIWTDPNPLPTPAERRYWFREQEEETPDSPY